MLFATAMKIINGVYRYILRTTETFVHQIPIKSRFQCLCGAWIALMYLLYQTKVQFSIKNVQMKALLHHHSQIKLSLDIINKLKLLAG